MLILNAPLSWERFAAIFITVFQCFRSCLPPLRERPEDIHPLVIHFLEHYKQKTGRFISGISKDALQALITYDWPGNVRELENAIERAVIIASGRQIELEDLPEAISKIALQEQDRIKVERAQRRQRRPHDDV